MVREPLERESRASSRWRRLSSPTTPRRSDTRRGAFVSDVRIPARGVRRRVCVNSPGASPLLAAALSHKLKQHIADRPGIPDSVHRQQRDCLRSSPCQRHPSVRRLSLDGESPLRRGPPLSSGGELEPRACTLVGCASKTKGKGRQSVQSVATPAKQSEKRRCPALPSLSFRRLVLCLSAQLFFIHTSIQYLFTQLYHSVSYSHRWASQSETAASRLLS